MSISNNKIESFQISPNSVSRIFQIVPTDQVSYLTTFKTASWYAVTTTTTNKILIFEWNLSTPLKSFTTLEELHGVETLNDDSKIVTVTRNAIGSFIEVWDRAAADGNSTPLSSLSLAGI